MSIKKIKVEDSEVEVLNSVAEKEPKITRIKADDTSNTSRDSSQQGRNPFEEMFNGNGNNPMNEQMKNNPLFKMAGNINELKNIKPYFFFSIVCGLIALFALREYLGTAAIVFGALDLWKGSKLTKTASYFGIFLGMVSLVLYFQ